VKNPKFMVSLEYGFLATSDVDINCPHFKQVASGQVQTSGSENDKETPSNFDSPDETHLDAADTFTAVTI
jgi:hypothetical protein